MRTPLVFGEEPKQIGREVAKNHERDIVDDETHDALRKIGVAPGFLCNTIPRCKQLVTATAKNRGLDAAKTAIGYEKPRLVSVAVPRRSLNEMSDEVRALQREQGKSGQAH